MTTQSHVAKRPLPRRAVRARSPLLSFVVRRLGLGVVTLVVASIVVFVGTSVIPGSPAAAVLGRQASPKVLKQIDAQIGYDKPVVTRYMSWLGGAVHGDFGNSAVEAAQGTRAPIWQIIRDPFANTVTLAVLTMIILMPLSLILGLAAGLRQGTWLDHAVSTTTLLFVAMPEFVVAAVLVALFSFSFTLLPPVSLLSSGQTPLAHPNLLVLPVSTLLVVSVAWTVRLVRVGTIEVAQQDYVRMARLQGVREAWVLRKYVLRNALAPSVQIFALSVQYLFGGVIVTESVFNYPGLGRQLITAVQGHDNTQVQAIAMLLAVIYVVINIVADLIVVVLVPKLRTAAS